MALRRDAVDLAPLGDPRGVDLAVGVLVADADLRVGEPLAGEGAEERRLAQALLAHEHERGVDLAPRVEGAGHRGDEPAAHHGHGQRVGVLHAEQLAGDGVEARHAVPREAPEVLPHRVVRLLLGEGADGLHDRGLARGEATPGGVLDLLAEGAEAPLGEVLRLELDALGHEVQPEAPRVAGRVSEDLHDVAKGVDGLAAGANELRLPRCELAQHPLRRPDGRRELGGRERVAGCVGEPLRQLCDGAGGRVVGPVPGRPDAAVAVARRERLRPSGDHRHAAGGSVEVLGVRQPLTARRPEDPHRPPLAVHVRERRGAGERAVRGGDLVERGLAVDARRDHRHELVAQAQGEAVAVGPERRVGPALRYQRRAHERRVHPRERVFLRPQGRHHRCSRRVHPRAPASLSTSPSRAISTAARASSTECTTTP